MCTNPTLRLLVLFALLLLTKPLLATDLTGKVVGVHDCDTLGVFVFTPQNPAAPEEDGVVSGKLVAQGAVDLGFGG